MVIRREDHLLSGDSFLATRARKWIRPHADGSRIKRIEDLSCQLPIEAHFADLSLFYVKLFEMDNCISPMLLFDKEGNLLRLWEGDYIPSLAELDELCIGFLADQ